MADLGTGVTGYPTEIDTNSTPQTGTEDTDYLPGKGACAAVIAMQTEFGVTPSQSKGTLKAYIGQEHDENGEHSLYLPIYFTDEDVAASQSAVELPVCGSVVLRAAMPIAGSIIGISVYSNEARTADTLTVDATIDGAVTGLQAILDVDNTTIHYAVQAKDVDSFVAGDAIGVKITTGGSWAPTTADILVTVFYTLN